MVNKIGVLLLFGLNLVSSLEMQPYKVNSTGIYQRIMELRPLFMEFSEHFSNITQADLNLPSSRLPSQQDLQCLADMTQLMIGLSSGKLWTLKLFDSWGSIPKGLLSGNTMDLGNYDECIGIKKSLSENYIIQGKYCLAKLPIVPLQSLGIPSEIAIGVCFPSSCSGAHMSAFFNQLMQKLLGLNLSTQLISDDTCRTSDRAPFDGLTIFTIVLLSVLGFALVLATFCDYVLYEDQTKLPIIVKAFSIRANSRALFQIVEPKSNPNIIDCFHGIRCMSLLWVIFGHEYIIISTSPNMNNIYLLSWFGKPFTNFVIHATFSVDTFLFISGLLLVVISMRALEKTKGRLNIPLMYLHRYLRLTPIVALAILIYMKLLPYLGDGPLMKNISFDNYEKCESNWFWTLLYLQNYATKDLCLNHTWYLAVDMQLYILSPIFLLSLYRWGKKAAAGIFVFMLLLSACLFSTMMTDKYFIHLEYGIISNNVQRKIYYATHTHAAPWLIGVLFGYFLHVNRSKNFQLNRIKICLGWIVSLALMFTCIFALYPYAKLTSPSLSILKQSSYYTFTRIAWPLSLCWVVFACMKGYGSLANSFLSAPIWQPLSKISYSAYIFHVFIVQINGRRARTNTYFSDYDMMLRFWGTFGFTLLLCYAIYCTTEAPIALLLGMLMPKRKTTPKSTVPEETKTESIPQLNKVAETETIPEIENLEEQSEANQKKRVEEL